MLSNNNLNRAKVDNEGIMRGENFEILQLQNLRETFDLSRLEESRIEGYMVSKKL